MADLKCPKCSRDFARRVSRRAWWEFPLGLFSLYPFRCQLCGARFRAFQRGVRYIESEEDRREYDRMEMRFPITFTSPEVSGEGIMLAVSMGGCNFSTVAAVPDGATLRLQMQLAPSLAPVVVDAARVRNVKAGRVGVEFIRWHASERERLELFVRGLLIGRQSPAA